MEFDRYQHLRTERRPDGVLVITLSRPEVLNAAHEDMHTEMAAIWADIDKDDQTRVAVVTGAGRAFSAGGDLAMVERQIGNFDLVTRMLAEMGELVYNMANCSKPIVSAINGVAVGAGLVVGLMADISICAEDARLGDGHVRLGVAAGDHAAIIWPLLCGMAKAKYHLLLCDPLLGAEAERIGLISLAVDDPELDAKSVEIAARLAEGAQHSIRWTKYALNNWLRQAGPNFDTSLALEFMGFSGPDVHEGVKSLRERRAPEFPGGDPF